MPDDEHELASMLASSASDLDAVLVRIDDHLARLRELPEAGFANTEAREAFDRWLAAKATLLVRAGRNEEALSLTERLRWAWNGELQRILLDRSFLEWRWVERTRARLPPTACELDRVPGAALKSCRPERSPEIPFLIRALSGSSEEDSLQALHYLMDHIVHQGGVYEVTPYVVRALATLLEQGVTLILIAPRPGPTFATVAA